MKPDPGPRLAWWRYPVMGAVMVWLAATNPDRIDGLFERWSRRDDPQWWADWDETKSTLGRGFCAATDGNNAICTMHAGHYGAIHREVRAGRLWAEWRSILPVDEPFGAQSCRCRQCQHAREKDR